METFLKIEQTQKEELKSVRRFIKDSFEELSCSLLPHPGSTVTGGKRKSKVPAKAYDGNWGGMEEDFKDELQALIEHLLSPERLVVKKINAGSLDSAKYYDFLSDYFKLFQSNELPRAQSIYESTVEKQMTFLVNDSFERYKELLFKNKDLIDSVDQIPILHEASKNAALIAFKDAKKMGNAGHKSKFEQTLIDTIEKSFVMFKSQTEAHIKDVNEQKEKTRLALEEKERAYREQVENEKKAAEKLLELERLSSEQKIAQEQYKKEKEIAELRLASEKQRREDLEKKKQEDEQYRGQMQAQLEALRQELARRPTGGGGGGGPCNIL
jgi:hypothetical protein